VGATAELVEGDAPPTEAKTESSRVVSA